MKIQVTPFVEFAYGDKRRDRAAVKGILEDNKKEYDPQKDRYKQFREALKRYEERKCSELEFKQLHSSVTNNKAAGYKALCENYLFLKEHYALVWEGRHPLTLKLGLLEIQTAWFLRTDIQNQRSIVFLNFRKNPFPQEQERAILTILQMAAPESAGAGVLNIQAGTLVSAATKSQIIVEYLHKRAEKFMTISDAL